MNIIVRTHHVSITPPLKAYAEKKVQKLSRYFENIQEIVVELDFVDAADENYRYVATATIKAPQSVMKAEEAADDMYKSIDMVVDKLEIQLKRYKEKRKDRKKPTTKRSLDAVVASDSPKKKSGLKLGAADPKLYITKPMTPEDAVAMIEIERGPLLVFRNSETDDINVIYPIKKGQYGLIET